jgi:hypothetical protein
MLNLPVHGPARPGPAPPLPRAAPVGREPLSPDSHYLSHRRTAGDTFLARPRHQPGGRPRADLEALLADVLVRRTASTAATYHKVLKIRYGWLAEERRSRPTRWVWTSLNPSTGGPYATATNHFMLLVSDPIPVDSPRSRARNEA